MASPQKHPRTGVYWFRKRVPERLRPLVGRTEVTRTLGTKDAAEARRRFVEVALGVEREWAVLEGGAAATRAGATVTSLTEKQEQGKPPVSAAGYAATA